MVFIVLYSWQMPSHALFNWSSGTFRESRKNRYKFSCFPENKSKLRDTEQLTHPVQLGSCQIGTQNPGFHSKPTTHFNTSDAWATKIMPSTATPVFSLFTFSFSRIETVMAALSLFSSRWSHFLVWIIVVLFTLHGGTILKFIKGLLKFTKMRFCGYTCFSVMS